MRIPLVGLPPSANKRLHWRARHKSNQEWKNSTTLLLRDQINKTKVKGLPWPKVHVRYEFHYPRTTVADLDNLIGSLKPALDALSGVLIPDDDSRYVHQISATITVIRGVPAGVDIQVDQCSCPE